MKCQMLNDHIKALFAGEILASTIVHQTELYIEVKPGRLREICLYSDYQLGYALVDLFASDERSLIGSFAVYYVFANRADGLLLTIKTAVHDGEPTIPSISGEIHAAALYEREIQDLFGIVPVDHPDGKRLVWHSNWPAGKFPLRKDYPLAEQPDQAGEPMEFVRVSGAGVYEIPVGPVHAGIIEPGHFRFSVAGEPIINLEAQLYFVHKGIEKLAESSSIERGLYIAERISGDETFSNSLAYCQALEKIAGVTIPERAAYTRLIFAELERLTSHLGDLAGICLDVGYGWAAYQFRMIRGWTYLVADALCGMRFLRSVNKLGGVRLDFLAGKESRIIADLGKIRREIAETVKIINGNSLFIDRVEHTGVLSREIAADLNAVGPGGRASGIPYDVRRSFPYLVYDQLTWQVSEHHNGDVNCRMHVKTEESLTAIDLMVQAIEKMPAGEIREAIGQFPPYRFAFGLTESPRGENIHWVMTGENSTIFRYKIRTPSFCNWPALCHAVKGNVVPDFPLINKSFNLSYAGNDL